MNKNIDKNNLNDLINLSKKILKVFYFILIVLGTYIILKILKELNIFNLLKVLLKILTPLFIGILVSWLLNPFVKWLEKKKIRRTIGTILSYIIFIGLIFLFVKTIIPLLYSQTKELIENFPSIFSSVKVWVNELFNNLNLNVINIENIKQNFITRLDEFSNSISTSLPIFLINSLSKVISSIGSFIVGLVIGFYLLLSCDNLGNTLLEIIPKKVRKNIYELIKQINQSLRNYVNGAFIDTIVVFVISTLAFALIGLKSPILFGLFCGLMNIIPYAGPYIGGAPAVIVAFSQGLGIGVAVLIAIIIIQMLEGNILQTLIISKTTKLNPVIIILGLLVFGHFFGIIGMLLSTPIISVIKVIIKYFDEKYDLLNFN